MVRILHGLLPDERSTAEACRPTSDAGLRRPCFKGFLLSVSYAQQARLRKLNSAIDEILTVRQRPANNNQRLTNLERSSAPHQFSREQVSHFGALNLIDLIPQLNPKPAEIVGASPLFCVEVRHDRHLSVMEEPDLYPVGLSRTPRRR